MTFRQKGDKAHYLFIDKRCIGRTCWAPGMFQHRSPLAGGGSMNTSSPDSACCMNRAYRGCPQGPEGEHQCRCPTCERAVGSTRGDCLDCGGSGLYTVTGLPIMQPELARQRKAEGWRAQ